MKRRRAPYGANLNCSRIHFAGLSHSFTCDWFCLACNEFCPAWDWFCVTLGKFCHTWSGFCLRQNSSSTTQNSSQSIHTTQNPKPNLPATTQIASKSNRNPPPLKQPPPSLKQQSQSPNQNPQERIPTTLNLNQPPRRSQFSAPKLNRQEKSSPSVKFPRRVRAWPPPNVPLDQ